MRGWRVAAVVALTGVPFVAAGCAGRSARVYTVAATHACLKALPGAIAGLPPATAPGGSALFVYSFPRDRLPPRADGQLGAWYRHERTGTYDGVILSFFKTRHAARRSRTSPTWTYGGRRLRNVIVRWDQDAAPRSAARKQVLGCLRAATDSGGAPAPAPAPRATLATFAGYWGGHTRGLRISPSGRGVETASDGCCVRVYDVTFQIRSVTGTWTRAAALYRVTSFKKYERHVRNRRKGDLGRLVLREGIVTNKLTGDVFCSNPAWGATGACGA